MKLKQWTCWNGRAGQDERKGTVVRARDIGSIGAQIAAVMKVSSEHIIAVPVANRCVGKWITIATS